MPRTNTVLVRIGGYSGSVDMCHPLGALPFIELLGFFALVHARFGYFEEAGVFLLALQLLLLTLRSASTAYYSALHHFCGVRKLPCQCDEPLRRSMTSIWQMPPQCTALAVSVHTPYRAGPMDRHEGKLSFRSACLSSGSAAAFVQ